MKKELTLMAVGMMSGALLGAGAVISLASRSDHIRLAVRDAIADQTQRFLYGDVRPKVMPYSGGYIGKRNYRTDDLRRDNPPRGYQA